MNQPGMDPYGQQQVQGYNPYAPPAPGTEAPAYGQDMYMGEAPLAERGTRLGAAIIDGLLAVGAALIGIILMAMAGNDETLMFAGMGVMGLGLLALTGYQWYLISTTGQSLAKKWMGIKIVKVDGQECGFVHGVILRIWVMGLIANIPFIGAIAGLVDPLLIFGEERRCLHDMIAGTKVIIATD